MKYEITELTKCSTQLSLCFMDVMRIIKLLILGRDGRFEGLTKLVPQQSCYYEAFNKRLACICKNMDMEASLDLKIVYFVENTGNEIR